MFNVKEKYFVGYLWRKMGEMMPKAHHFHHILVVVMNLMFALANICDLGMRINHMHTKCPYKTVIYCKIVLYRFKLKKTEGMDSKANIRTVQTQI